MTYVNFGDSTIFELRKEDGVPQIIISSGAISVSTCTDDNITAEQLRNFAKALNKLADEFEPKSNLEIYYLKDIHTKQYVSSLDEYGNMTLDDSPLIMTMDKLSRYKSYYQLGINVTLFGREIGDNRYFTGIIDRGSKIYSNTPREILMEHNLISEIMNKLKHYNQRADWSWILQSSEISLLVDV